MTRETKITLSPEDLELLAEALDSHEYWQLGCELPRSNGLVLVPGDRDPDLIWEGRTPTPDEREAIEGISRCRVLSARLDALASAALPDIRRVD